MFCVAMKYTPEQYYALTVEQHAAIVTALNERE